MNNPVLFAFLFKVTRVCQYFLCLAIIATVAFAQSPVPIVNQPLVPDVIPPGSGSFELTVNGTGFVSDSVVYWNGTPRITSLVSNSQLTAAISASDVVTPQTAIITVVNSVSGQVSDAGFFAVTDPIPTLVTTQVSYPGIGGGRAGVVTADFNGDGNLDIAAGGVTVALGNGDGTLRTPVIYAVGGSAGLVTGDFNGDGNLDLATGDSDLKSVLVLLGNGKGAFKAQRRLHVQQYIRAIEAGDFDGDSHLDLVIATQIPNNISIALGNGDGTFGTVKSVSVPPMPYSVTVGDFNRDGKLDVAATGIGENRLSVLLGNGDGTLQPALGFTIPDYGPDEVRTADLNGDGKLDIVLAGVGLAIMLGRGNGTFQPFVGYGPEELLQSLTFGDFNGDGKLDIAAVGDFYYPFDSLLYTGNGDGSFQDPIQVGSVIGPDAVFPGDFNSDGKLDFVIMDGSNCNLVLQGSLSFTPQVTFTPDQEQFGNIPVGASAIRKAQLTNSGNAPLVISDISFVLEGASAYQQTNTCGDWVYPGASCTFTITFTPPKAGLFPASLSVEDASGSPHLVHLHGAGI